MSARRRRFLAAAASPFAISAGWAAGSSGTVKETKQYHARRHAEMVYEKQQYVDKLKRKINKCHKCERHMLPGEEAAFPFDHTDESTKRKCRCLDEDGNQKGPCHGCPYKLFGRGGGVAGLVSNHTKAASLDKVEHLIVAEAGNCRLKCDNCHHRRTWRYDEE